ncbi:MAG: hypothetical protein OEV84_09915, partial [Betaproteobacteria bacterium]|nr:hypothetical protein [Betaproteobacteria bacterium]
SGGEFRADVDLQSRADREKCLLPCRAGIVNCAASPVGRLDHMMTSTCAGNRSHHIGTNERSRAYKNMMTRFSMTLPWTWRQPMHVTVLSGYSHG